MAGATVVDTSHLNRNAAIDASATRQAQPVKAQTPSCPHGPTSQTRAPFPNSDGLLCSWPVNHQVGRYPRIERPTGF